ncbi:cell division protein FtsZ [Paracoccus litorisediminis]|uniref:cell division protein FtsZ n=1 Tax=Paracoccus litorisediminis TaxID=2006130 RepID=UPI00372E3D83
MSLKLIEKDDIDLKPRITVFGVGGAGGNAVNNMIVQQLEGVEFVVANTDAQALQHSKAHDRIQIGPKATAGLGAGAKPSVGASAAEETIEEIVEHLSGSHMCFITAGMGGGTGTGAAPVIAKAAREMGILTVGVVTKPFQFEGSKRMRQANEGVEELQKHVDTLIIIPNQNLFRLATEKTTFTEAFAMADDVLYQGVKGVTDLMVRPGLINLDFADVRSVMDEMGKAMMGTGEAEGENRAVQAAERAIANPLLDDISLNGAKGVLINITGGHDLTLFEMDEAAEKIREKVDPDANIIVGSTLDPSMDGVIRVSVVATGIDTVPSQAPAPTRHSSHVSRPVEPPKHEATAAPAPVAEARVAPTPEPRVAKPAAPAASQWDESDMPKPAYQPRQAHPASAFDQSQDDHRASRHYQGHGADHGEPAPQVMDRLRRAVETSGNNRPHPAPQQEEPSQARMSGLGRMFSRLTGQEPAPHQHQHHAQPAARQHYPRRGEEQGGNWQHPDYNDPADENEEPRGEVPSFLRRQHQ